VFHLVLLCLHAVTTTPAVTDGICSLVPFHQCQPSPSVGRVGSCIGYFGACSVFTSHYGLPDLPSRLKRPSTPEAPAASLPPLPLRLLPGGANQFPGGTLNPRWTSAFTRRTSRN
jgi:hypothetical protein